MADELTPTAKVMTGTDGKAKTTRTPPARPEYKSPQEIISAYVAYRRALIQATLGPPGINRGGAAAINAQASMHVLTELEALARWLEDGQPSSKAVLTEGDKAFWRDAQSRGMDVPREIAEKL